MKVIDTEIPGLLIIEPEVFGDARGFFLETWQEDRYADHGLPRHWTQDNVSRSSRGVLRGLHVQTPNAQAKLVSVLDGEVFDVAVDIRRGSPNFGEWVGLYLSDENHRQLWIPAGFAHGFQVTSESALLAYKCVGLFDPAAELTVIYDDPDIGIEWPGEDRTLSEKDAAGIRLGDVPPDRLPLYEESS